MSKKMLNLDDIELHFLLAKGRTGSTLISRVLNSHPSVVSPMEEPFLLFLSAKYKECVFNSKSELSHFIDDLILFSRFNMVFGLYDKKELITFVEPYLSNLTYINLCKLVYLYSSSEADLSKVKFIIDKQLSYLVLIKDLVEICPKSKIIILTRNPLDNAVVCKNGGYGRNDLLFQVECWRQYYSYNIKKVFDQQAGMTVKYEDFVRDPIMSGNQLASFIGFNFSVESVMVKSHNIDSFWKNSGGGNSEEIRAQFEKSNGSLNYPISTEKVGLWERQLSSAEKEEAIKLLQDLPIIWGYDFTAGLNKLKQRPKIISRLRIVEAKIRSRIVLETYMKTPFIIRKLVKLFRKKVSRS